MISVPDFKKNRPTQEVNPLQIQGAQFQPYENGDESYKAVPCIS